MSRPLDVLQNEIRKSEGFRLTSESLLKRSLIKKGEIDYIYEMIFLSLLVELENYIEDIIIEMMCGSHVPVACNFHRRIVFRSSIVAREALYGGLGYTNLLPIDRAIVKAKIFFRGGRPFSLIGDDEKKILSFLHAIRNCIAHKSRSSIISFERELSKRHTLPPSQRTPARYLRSGFSARRTRYEVEIGNLLGIVRKLDWGS